jgi:hypothetical protein
MAAGTLQGVSSRTTGKNQLPMNIALFIAAPFIGLAYIVVFPFVGFGALGKYALQAAATRK